MRRLGLLAGVLLLAGCANMLNPEGKTATPSPSPLPTGVANINRSEDVLDPGRYSRRDFEPRVTFELDGPWYARQVFDGFFDVQQGDPDDPDVVAIQFARPRALYGAEGATEPADAADAVAILETHPDLEAIETSTSRMGGLDGRQVTVENGGEDAAELMDLPPGTIAILPDRRLWIAFFDTDDGLLAIMVGGSIEGWTDALATAEPVLESVEIGD